MLQCHDGSHFYTNLLLWCSVTCHIWHGRVNFCLTSVHVQCTCSVYSTDIDYLIVLYEYLFCYPSKSCGLSWRLLYNSQMPLFWEFTAMLEISLIWLCPVLPGIPFLGISWYLCIFIVSQKFVLFYIECKIIFLYKMPKKGLLPRGYIYMAEYHLFTIFSNGH